MRLTSIIFLIVCVAGPAGAQEAGPPNSGPGLSFLPNTPNGPQARTRPELDAFGLVMEAWRPPDVIATAESFSRAFPDSQLLPLVKLKEMEAEMNSNSYEGTVALGHDILRRSPDNLEALLLMAQTLPNFPPAYANRKPQILAEAAQCRAQAEDLLEKFHLPEGASAREFAEGKARMRLSLRASSAFAALVGGQYPESIEDYQWVMAHGGDNVPAYHLCLGLAYQHAGDAVHARAELQKAVDTGSGTIRERAAAALREAATIQ